MADSSRLPFWAKAIIALLFLVGGSSVLWQSVGEYQVLAQQLEYMQAKNHSYDDVGRRLSMRFAQQSGNSGDGRRRMELQRRMSTWSMLGFFGFIAVTISGSWLIAPMLKSMGQVLEMRREDAQQSDKG